MGNPAITTILATRNGSRFINRAITSVLGQSEPSIELIIVNDGSTDNTLHIATEWAQKDPRVKVVTLEKNVGPGKARDRGIREAKGTYIALIDDDDYWISKDKLLLQKQFLDQHPDVVLVGSAHTHIVKKDESLEKYYDNPQTDEEIRNSILLKNRFITSSILFRKDIYMHVGGFSPRYLAEDYELWLRIGKVGKFSNITGIDTAYTVHSGGASKKRRFELYRAVLSIVWQNKNNYPHAAKAISMALGRLLLFPFQNLT